MTLLWTDGMALYADSTAAITTTGKYSTGSWSTYRLAGAFTGSYAAQQGNGATYIAVDVAAKFGSGFNTGGYVVGFRHKANALGGGINTSGFFALADSGHLSSGSELLFLSANSDGTLGINSYDSTVSTLTSYSVPSGTFTIATGVWNYYEVKLLSTGASGRFIVRVNGTQVYDSGIKSLYATLNYVKFGANRVNAGTSSSVYSDAYIASTAGAINNDFLGDVRIETLVPNADGSNTGFAIGPGSNLVSTNQWGFESGTTGWQYGGASERTTVGALLGVSYAASATTFTVSTVNFVEGSQSLQMKQSGIGLYHTTPGTSGIAVSPSTTYSVAHRGYPLQGSTERRMGVIWYDTGGTIISASCAGGTGNYNENDRQWASTGGTVTSPSNAAYAAIFISSETSNVDRYADMVGLYQNANGIQYRAPGDTSHYKQVAEASDGYSDGDRTYVTASVVGAKDTYQLSDLNSTSGQVIGVNTTTVVRKENPTPRTLAAVLRPTTPTPSAGTKYTVMSNSTAGSRLQDVGSAMTQLSDGTLVYLAYDPTNATFQLYYTVDRVNVNLIATFSSGNTSSTQFFAGGAFSSIALVTDSSDNIYLIAGNGNFSDLMIYALTKGVGYTWTSSSSGLINGTQLGGTTPNAVRAVWCNTGGGTSNKGHLVVLWNNNNVGVKMTSIDAGAVLANATTGAGISANTVNPAAGGTNVTTGIDIQTNGFGVTSGVTAVSYTSGSPILNFGQWTIDSSGAFTINSAIGSAALGQQTSTRIRILRMLNNTYACLHPTSTGLAVVPFNLTTVNTASFPTMTTGTTASDVAATWQPYWNSANTGWDAFVDTSGKGWVYSGSSVATTLLKWGFTQSGTTATLDAAAPTKLDASVGPSASTNGTGTTVRGCQVVQSAASDIQVFNTWNTLYSLLGDFGGALAAGADYVGTAADPGNALTYSAVAYIAETNPTTGQLFTLAQVNALEAGVKLVS